MSWVRSSGITNGGALSDIPTWFSATDEEVVSLLNAHYNNQIDLTQYWTVGDIRYITLTASSANSFVVPFILYNIGGKELVEPINGHTECAFIVGMLYTTESYWSYKMNSSKTNSGGWGSCEVRTFCNETFPTWLPSSLSGIFKQHINYQGRGDYGGGVGQSQDYFALPAEKEVIGSTYWAKSTDEADLSQFEWFTTSANQIKYGMTDTGGSYYWLRSARSSSSTDFVEIQHNGSEWPESANSSRPISPFGVI